MPNTITANIEDGMLKTVFVDAIADVTAPTLTELQKTPLDLSYYLAGDGFQISHTQDMIDDDREGAAAVGQIPGAEKFDGGTMQVIDNTNTGDSNEAVEKLVRGTSGYIVRRRGKPTDEPFKAGDVVSVYKVLIGIKTPLAHGTNQRQMSNISFSADPGSQEETATVAGAAATNK